MPETFSGRFTASKTYRVSRIEYSPTKFWMRDKRSVQVEPSFQVEEGKTYSFTVVGDAVDIKEE